MAELRFTPDGLVDMGAIDDAPVDDDVLDAAVPPELSARWDDLVAAAPTAEVDDDLVPDIDGLDEPVDDGDFELDDVVVLDDDEVVDDVTEPVLEDDDEVLSDEDDDLDDLTDDDTDIDLL